MYMHVCARCIVYVYTLNIHVYIYIYIHTHIMLSMPVRRVNAFESFLRADPWCKGNYILSWRAVRSCSRASLGCPKATSTKLRLCLINALKYSKHSKQTELAEVQTRKIQELLDMTKILQRNDKAANSSC